MDDTAQHEDARPNADQIAYWNDRAGRAWTAWSERLDRAFAGLTALALARAAPRPGETALDVGCGCGATTLALAQAVAPGGRVLGVDVSEPMAARARERIAAAGIHHAPVVVDDAAAHPFRPEADLVFSRFGVMFFEDPVRAFTNLRGALRPGAGRLLFACWRAPAENPFFAVPAAVARAVLPPEPRPDPLAPGPFAFADPGRVRAVLAEAGWTDVTVEPADAPIQLAGAGAMEEAVALPMSIGPLARAVEDATDEAKAQMAAALRTALAPFDGPAGVSLPGAVWLVGAQ